MTAVVAGVAAHYALDAVAGATLPPFVTFFPMLPAIGLVAGVRLALVALSCMAAFAAWAWMEPDGQYSVRGTLGGISLIAFFVAGAFAAWVGALARHAIDEVHRQIALAETRAHEAAHRTKNVIAVVDALAQRMATTTPDVPSYVKNLKAKLRALGVAQDLLFKSHEQTLTLKECVEAAAAHLLDQPNFHMLVASDTPAPGPALTGIALAIHELGSNSLKYGALGSGQGSVVLVCADHPSNTELVWQEDFPVLAAPERVGFGSQLIRNALSSLEDSQVDYAITREGVRCTFRWPRVH